MRAFTQFSSRTDIFDHPIHSKAKMTLQTRIAKKFFNFERNKCPSEWGNRVLILIFSQISSCHIDLGPRAARTTDKASTCPKLRVSTPFESMVWYIFIYLDLPYKSTKCGTKIPYMDPMGHVSTINIAMGPNPSLDEEAVERLRSESRMPSKPEAQTHGFEHMGDFHT